MLSDRQKALYDAFYTSTHQNEFLDSKTELLVGLAAAMAMNCLPCTRYYLRQCQAQAVRREEVGEVLAKVMAVAAGQKRLQTQGVFEELKGEFADYWQE